MTALILSLIPLKQLVLLGGGLVAFVGVMIRGRAAAVRAQNAKVALAKALTTNHEVAREEAAAETDKEADAALDADSRTDRD